MNKRTVLASLNKIANQLDIEGLHNEADTVTKVMSRLAYDDFELGLGALPHRRIDSPMNSSDYDDEDGDIDLSDYEDDDMDMEDDDMGSESEPFDYSSPEDEGDMYGEADGSDYGDDF